MSTPTPAGSEFTRVKDCDLCRALKLTPWFFEDQPPEAHATHMRERLREVATAQLGEFWVDGHMRNIPDHFHAHARPKDGFFGRDRKR